MTDYIEREAAEEHRFCGVGSIKTNGVKMNESKQESKHVSICEEG